MSRWLEQLQALDAEDEEAEGTVAPGAEYAQPGGATQPEQSPTVSDQGLSVENNVQEEDSSSQYWSDVLQDGFRVVPTAAQVAKLAAQGQIAYCPDEIWYLRDLKARDPQGFPAELKAIHQAKSLFGATIVHEAPPTTGRTAGRAARERPVKPRDPNLGPILPPCVTCGELRHWHEHTTDTWHCWTCTPPPPRRSSPDIFFSAPVAVEGDEAALLTPERGIPLPRSPAPCWQCKRPSERQGVRFLLCPQCQRQEDIERQEVGDA
jgi:hypothetical protein